MARDNETPNIEGLTLLPTDKYHISFSELSDWVECPFRHKLKHIDKISIPDRSHYLDFGIAVHAACENFLRTGKMDASVAIGVINEAWERYGHEENEGKIADLNDCIAQAEGICGEVSNWMDATFPNWEVVSPEHFLYEQIGERPHAFKGFIDAVIKVTTVLKNGKKKVIYWLLDWKTTTWGWNRAKKMDRHKQRQLIYYKNFWSKETGIDPKKIRCGFVLLKRTAKPGNRCELIKVSVGEVSTRRALKVVNNMLSSIKRGMSLKNKYNCQWCVYKDTEHCF